MSGDPFNPHPANEPANQHAKNEPAPLPDVSKANNLDDWSDEAAIRGRIGNTAEGWRLSHFMWLIAAIAVVLWLFVIYRGFVIAGGVVILFVSAMGLGLIVARRRIGQQDSLLWILSIAANRGLPLGPTLSAFADQFGGRARRRIQSLADLIEGGSPVPEALEQVPRLVSRDAVLMAHMGQATGRLAEALQMAATSRASQLPIWTAIASRFGYLLFVLLTMQGICGSMLYFILPKFEAIFKDFGVPLPAVTIGLIDASHFVIRYAPFTVLIPPIEVILLILLPFSFAGWTNYDVPIFDRMLRRRHSALILRALSLPVETGKPIEAGVSILADHYPTWWVRRKLIRVDNLVQHGANWIDELHREGLISDSDRDVLRSASVVGNLAWAMQELAETGERRLSFRFQAVIQTLFPLVILALGAAVFLLMFGFFAPLVELIRRLAG